MKAWYRESAENVLKDMGSSRSGLTQQQAEAVRKKAGENVPVSYTHLDVYKRQALV